MPIFLYVVIIAILESIFNWEPELLTQLALIAVVLAATGTFCSEGIRNWPYSCSLTCDIIWPFRRHFDWRL